MEILQNSWVVGIGGGIISGLVVYALTALIFSKQSKREFERRVLAANQEIVLAVRQGVPEHRVPSNAVLQAMIEATARKHSLQGSDLYGTSEVAQDLIKDVMDSSFISAETKEAYSDRLAALIVPPPADAEESVSTSSESSGQFAVMSVALSVMAAVTTLFLVVFVDRSPPSARLESVQLGLWAPLVTTAMATLVAIAAAVWVYLRRQRERYDRLVSWDLDNALRPDLAPRRRHRAE